MFGLFKNSKKKAEAIQPFLAREKAMMLDELDKIATLIRSDKVRIEVFHVKYKKKFDPANPLVTIMAYLK